MSDFEGSLRSRAEARVGTVLRGKWRIQRVLGIGGMATVFEATHRNGKRGAVKMLHLELCVDPGVRSRFLREGYVANQVDHPGAVSVLDDDDDEDGSVFLVMELLDGESLDAVARSRPAETLPVGEVLAIADAVLDTLAAAHDKGIVHRDLKPENLFLTTRGEVKVLDFGIARMREGSGGTSRRTKDGSQMGTPAFMSPEQALGNWDSVNARSDLWAVGATLFTLLTGRSVHLGGSVNQVLLAAMTKPAPKLGSVALEIPAEAAAVIDRALEQDPNERWEDARAMQQEVRRVRGVLGLNDVTLRPRPPEPAAASGQAAAPPAPGLPTVVEKSPAAPEPEALPPEPAPVEAGTTLAEPPALPTRTAPGLAAAAPLAAEPSKRRLAVGIAAAVVIVAGVALATVSFAPRDGSATGDARTDGSDQPRTAPAPSSTGPTVEVGEPAMGVDDAASARPGPSVSPAATAPPRSSSQRGKPTPSGDPFNRWR